MQFFDFEKVMQYGVEKEIERLIHKAYISPDIAKDIDRKAIEAFLLSGLFRKIRTSRRVYREQRFNIKLSASEFTEDTERKKHLYAEEVFVQGVIDCVFEDENGRIVLVDYKTDSFPRHFPREQIEQTLKDRYKDQLEYYKKAVEKLLLAGALEKTKKGIISINTVSGKSFLSVYKTQKFLIYNGLIPNILYNVMIGVPTKCVEFRDYDVLLGASMVGGTYV